MKKQHIQFAKVTVKPHLSSYAVFFMYIKKFGPIWKLVVRFYILKALKKTAQLSEKWSK